MKQILRNKSIITGNPSIKHLYTFPDFPVFFGAVDTPQKDDVVVDMEWGICKNTGVIQLEKLIPLEVLYQSQHVDAIGITWQKHNKAFVDYVLQNNPRNVLEIGGGSGKLAMMATSMNPKLDWTIIEPNPLIEPSERIKVIPTFFDGHALKNIDTDTIVFSHVLEHMYNPKEFLLNASGYLHNGDYLLFSYPNLLTWLKKKYLNTLNFEHTCFLTDYFVDYLLEQVGFTILEKSYYGEHSIFYRAIKRRIQSPMQFVNKYDEYATLFNDYIAYYNNLTNELNGKISQFDGDVYLFGGHIFSQYLIQMGLHEKNIKGILDNSPLKQSKRLYGTGLSIYDPQIITHNDTIAIVLKAGVHQEEIEQQLRNLNKNVVIWS